MIIEELEDITVAKTLFTSLLIIVLATGCFSELQPSHQPIEPKPTSEQQIKMNEPVVWLLFEQWLDSIQTLHRLRLYDSTEVEPLLTADQKKPETYYLAPDGQHAVLRTDGMIRVIDLTSGTEVATLDSGPRLTMEFTTVEVDNDVVWSPKGDKFVFLVESWYLSTDIMMYDLSTGELSQLTNDMSRINAPTWSPDGKQLAFAIWESCGESLEQCEPEENYWDIGIIDIDGSNFHLITDMANYLPISSDWTTNSLCHLQWSPDKNHIVFKSYCPTMTIPTYDEIFVTKTDSSQTFRLTEFGDIDYAHNYAAGWTPDSNYLIVAFSRNYIFDDFSNEYGFLVFDTNSFTKEPSKTEINGLNPYYISWSPQKEYVIAPIGIEHSFLGQIEEDQVTVITETLPRISSAGYWTSDGYVTQWQNRVIKIMIPDGEIKDLDIELEEGMTLIGWRQLDMP